MRISSSRAFAAVGFSVLFALTAACGGSKPEAKAPTTKVAESTPVGSPAPAVSPESTSEPPKDTTPSSTKDGSDIIPPFTAGKDPAAAPAGKKSTATKGAKKGGGKPKKKSTQAAGKSGAT